MNNNFMWKFFKNLGDVGLVSNETISINSEADHITN